LNQVELHLIKDQVIQNYLGHNWSIKDWYNRRHGSIWFFIYFQVARRAMKIVALNYEPYEKKIRNH